MVWHQHQKCYSGNPWQKGEVPDDWREANVTPIFMKRSKRNPGNYRQVLLTSVCCKVMESVIRDAVTVSPTAVIVYLENIGFVYPAMSMMVIGPSLLY
jgi:hypothetical protein